MRVSSKVFPADEGVAKQQSEGGLILSSKKLMCSSSDSLSVRASNEPLFAKIMGKAPTRVFSWLKAPTTAFTFKTLLRHYAKRALTPRSLNVKLGP